MERKNEDNFFELLSELGELREQRTSLEDAITHCETMVHNQAELLNALAEVNARITKIVATLGCVEA